jgi:hypothetical protein
MFTSTYVIEDLARLHREELIADAEATRLAGIARRHGRRRAPRRHRATAEDRGDGVSHPVATLAVCEPHVTT